MRKVLVVVLSVLALVLGATSVAGAAGKPAYKVTLRTSVASSVAEKFITVAGTVTGPKAVGRNVVIQRKYVGGPWRTVATAPVKRSGKFSARVETPKGGTTSFRAIKPRSSARKAGVSPTRAIPVYQWISLAFGGLHSGDVQTGTLATIGGKSYPALRYWDDVGVIFKLNRLCTTLTTLVTYIGPVDGQAATLHLHKYPSEDWTPTTTSTVATSGGPVTSVQTSLTHQGWLSVQAEGLDSDYHLVVANPRAYCNASSLPAFSESELP